uniref:Uncharacterized protein n=1 Tax=Bactrocera dorsalis TaxID=27457 RepID=A0A034WD80_BACDO
MSVLACVKLSDSPTHKEIDVVITHIQNKYDLSEEKIICNVIDNVRDFIETYHNFSIKSFCPDDHNADLSISHSNAQGLLNQLSKQFKYAMLMLMKWRDFYLKAICHYPMCVGQYGIHR